MTTPTAGVWDPLYTDWAVEAFAKRHGLTLGKRRIFDTRSDCSINWLLWRDGTHTSSVVLQILSDPASGAHAHGRITSHGGQLVDLRDFGTNSHSLPPDAFIAQAHKRFIAWLETLNLGPEQL